MKIRLTRKHAERINGIDLSAHRVGDVFELPTDQAHLILAENWAHPERRFATLPTEQLRRADDGQRLRTRKRKQRGRP